MQHPIVLTSFAADGSATVLSANATEVRFLVHVPQVGDLGRAILARLLEALFHGADGRRTLVLLGTSPRAGNLALPAGTPVVRLPSLDALHAAIDAGMVTIDDEV